MYRLASCHVRRGSCKSIRGCEAAYVISAKIVHRVVVRGKARTCLGNLPVRDRRPQAHTFFSNAYVYGCRLGRKKYQLL